MNELWSLDKKYFLLNLIGVIELLFFHVSIFLVIEFNVLQERRNIHERFNS